MTYEDLLRNISKGRIAKGYIFAGKEEALKRDAVLRIRDKIGASLIFGEKEALQEDIFGGKRIVVLNELKTGLIKRDILPIAFVEKAKDFPKDVPIVSFPKLHSGRLKFWIKERFKEKERTITESAMNLLSEGTGEDISLLLSEIEKITLFCDKKWLKEDDISPILCKNPNKDIFDLLDAIGERKMDALSICNNLLFYGASPSYILFMIEKRMREIFSLKDGIKEEKMQDWQYRKTCSYERLFLKDEAYSIFSKLAECDLKLKLYSSNSKTIILLNLIYELVSCK